MQRILFTMLVHAEYTVLCVPVAPCSLKGVLIWYPPNWNTVFRTSSVEERACRNNSV